MLCYGAADPPVLCYGAAPTSLHLGGSNTQTTSGEMRLLTPTRSCPGCDFWSGAPQIPAFFLGLFFPPFFFRTSYFFQPADKKKKDTFFDRLVKMRLSVYFWIIASESFVKVFNVGGRGGVGEGVEDEGGGVESGVWGEGRGVWGGPRMPTKLWGRGLVYCGALY